MTLAQELIITIRNANNNWFAASKRGDDKSMRQNSDKIDAATNQLKALGYSLEEIWKAVEA